MGAFPVGTVVLVRFPFSDLAGAKLRPAVVLADAGRDDSILCQITSSPYADPRSIELTDESFETGSLQRVSYVRPAKLFTAHASLVTRPIGRVDPETRSRIVAAIIALFQAT